MGKVMVGMTMSLDGFVQDSQGSVGALYADFATLRETEPMQEAMQQTGAVVMGGKTFAMVATLWVLLTSGYWLAKESKTGEQ